MKLLTAALALSFSISLFATEQRREFFLEPCVMGFAVDGQKKMLDSLEIGDQAEFIFLNSPILVTAAKAALLHRILTLPWTVDDIQVLSAQAERLLEEAYSIGNDKDPFRFIRVTVQVVDAGKQVTLHVDDHGEFSPERRSSVRGVTTEKIDFNSREGTRVSLTANASQ